jgi:uncharacterized protein YjbI with pentapeptide repeats
MFALKPYIYLTLFLFSLFANPLVAGQLSSSTEVQANIAILTETKSCPQCDLSGADLNRLDLSGANLEGANLSRATMSLANLSGANLQNADLREAVLNGADLANVDLRGADVTGTSLAGAYMSGALMDGEIVVTALSDHEDISDIEGTVYVEDAVNPKASQETEEITIGSRRDFEETPPAVPGEKVHPETAKVIQPVTAVENVAFAYDEESLPEQSAAAPAAKAAPAIQEVRVEEEVIESEMLLTDERKKQLSTEGISAVAGVDEGRQRTQQDTLHPVVASRSVEAPGAVDQAVGIVQSLFNVFVSDEPSTEVLKNVAVLLDVTQCYGCNLAGVNLSGENLESADLEGADLSYSILTGVDLE